MKHRHFFSLGILVLYSVIGTGQESNYELGSYLYPDVQRRQFNISPSFEFTNFGYSNSTTKRLSLRSNYSLFEFINSRKRQSRFSISGNVGYKDYSNDVSSTPIGFHLSNYISWTNRAFFKEKRYFEIDLNAAYRYNDSSFSSDVSKPSFLDLSIAPKLGFGRMEFVSDAWHALELLRVLRKEGLLLIDPSEEQITQLANTLSQIKNFRNPDARLESIAEFEELCRFLIENGFCSAEEYGVFALIKDVYDFEGFVTREHGRTFAVGIEAKSDQNDFDNISFNNFILNSYSALIEYKNNKAFKEFWQYNQSYSAKVGQQNLKIGSDEDFFGYKALEVQLSNSIGYYLSRRTFATLGLTATLQVHDGGYNENNSLSAFMNYNYYFSPQTRFYVRGNYFVYSNNTGHSLENLDLFSVNAGVNYFFF